MTLPAPTYITEAEVKDQTLIQALKDLEPADRNALITAAEDQIDAYVGPQPHHPYDDNVTRVFPREQDYSVVIAGGVKRAYPETPEVPYQVGRAALRQVEFLFAQWWSDRATKELPSNYAVESQAIGGDGSYSETRARGGTSFAEASLCDQAKLLLQPFVSRFVGVGVTDVRTSVPPLTDGLC